MAMKNHHCVLKRRNYGNVTMLSPDGIDMCRIRHSKANWYVGQGLAEQIEDEPRKIQLKFKPKGLGNQVNPHPFYFQSKKNICVVCGSEKNLTRHHVIPSCFSKYFTRMEKVGHDVVLMCLDCHAAYEIKARVLYRKLCEDNGIEYSSNDFYRYDRNKGHVSGRCNTILRHRDKIPPDRLKEMLKVVSDFLGREPTNEDLENLRDMQSYYRLDMPNFGKTLFDKMGSRELCFVWRRHFVEEANPQFLPDFWSIDHDYQWQVT